MEVTKHAQLQDVVIATWRNSKVDKQK